MFTPAALGILYLLAVAWPLARIDWREHRLPNRLVLPAFPITLTGQLASLLLGEPFERLVRSTAVAVLIFTLALLMNRYAGLGMGDVKLLAAMALSLAWFGGEYVFYTALCAFVFAGLFVLVSRFRRPAAFSSAIALGPFLLGGYLVAVVSHLQ